MFYFANPCANPSILAAMRDHHIGFIDTPRQANTRPPGVLWCADNGCYGDGWPGEDAWLQWLGRNRHDADRCYFATAPDVVGDAAATLTRSAPMLPLIRAMGYRAALVAQDGLEQLTIPWPDIDCLFIGGTTAWKLGAEARTLAGEARRRGKWIHLGRVNSARRYRYAEHIGCHSADGTFLTFGPDTNLPKLRAWLNATPLPFGVAP